MLLKTAINAVCAKDFCTFPPLNCYFSSLSFEKSFHFGPGIQLGVLLSYKESHNFKEPVIRILRNFTKLYFGKLITDSLFTKNL